MPKPAACLAVASLMLFLGAQSLSAPPPRKARAGKARTGKAAFGRKKLDQDAIRDELKLTSTQEAQFNQMYQTFRQATSNWLSENGQQMRALSTQSREARADGEPQAAQAAQQKMGELMRARQKIADDFAKQLEDVLTPEQMVSARRLLGLRPPPPPPDPLRTLFALRAMSLTEEQKAKVAKILEGALTSIQGDVLTEEQRKQLDLYARTGARPGGDGSRDPLAGMGVLLARLGLTDEQKKQIESMQQETAAKAGKASTPRERQTLMSGLQKRIYGEVLTDEQREQVRRLRRKDQSPRAKGTRNGSVGKR